jgi:hypothetical protein
MAVEHSVVEKVRGRNPLGIMSPRNTPQTAKSEILTEREVKGCENATP